MKPSYQTHDPKGWCGDPSRGAALGRYTIVKLGKDEPVRLYLSLVRLDQGGYDCNGTYFGIGEAFGRLYWYADANGKVDAVLRAADREEAKEIIWKSLPKATFFR